MSERVCPVTPTGLHKKRPWQGQGRSGMACVACHKTWTWRGDVLVPTYGEGEDGSP